MLNVFSFLKPLFELNVSPLSKKPDTLLLTWGLGIFFSVTIFLSEALTKSTLQQSIKDPFYISDWKESLRFFTFFFLLIFSVFLSGFDGKNLLVTAFKNSFFILLSAFLLSVLFCKIKSFDFKLIRPLYCHFVWTFFSSAVFFLGSIILYKWFTYGPSAVLSYIFPDCHDTSKYISSINYFRTPALTLTIFAYCFLILTSSNLFIEFTKLLYDSEKEGIYWRIFYTDPSQEKSVFEIITNEIIKDSEGYYCIPNSNRPGVTQMIPISSIVRIDKHTESSGVKMEDSVESSERMCLKENPMNPDIPTESKKKKDKDKDKKDQKKNKNKK